LLIAEISKCLTKNQQKPQQQARRDSFIEGAHAAVHDTSWGRRLRPVAVDCCSGLESPGVGGRYAGGLNHAGLLKWSYHAGTPADSRCSTAMAILARASTHPYVGALAVALSLGIPFAVTPWSAHQQTASDGARHQPSSQHFSAGPLPCCVSLLNVRADLI